LLEGAGQAGCRPLIERAYEVAATCHRGQRRRSGDPYITHPVEVAGILADLDMSAAVLCAALLHDVLADSPYTAAQLRDDFGSEIAGLVEQGTSMDQYRSRYGSIAEAIDAAQADSERQALIIKLADRLHNMRTLRYLPPVKQQRKSQEVLEGFAPLARNLGMSEVEHELVSLARAALAGNSDRSPGAPPEPVR
jgi:GTP pyrophosphokinase